MTLAKEKAEAVMTKNYRENNICIVKVVLHMNALRIMLLRSIEPKITHDSSRLILTVE